jgi:hypothetical protein
MNAKPEVTILHQNVATPLKHVRPSITLHELACGQITGRRVRESLLYW